VIGMFEMRGRCSPFPRDASGCRVASSRRAHILAGAFLSIGIGIAAQSIAAVPATVEQARRSALAEGDLQASLPTGEPAPTAWSLDLPLPPIPREVFWILALGGVLFALYHLRDVIPGWFGRSARGWTQEGEGGTLAPAAAAAAVMREADELARAGLYGEAMHRLLLKSLADIRRRLGLSFSDSLTSREILGRARLPANGNEALRDIVLRVELSYFGERPAGPADYEACRRRFDELAAALDAGAPA
jgi:hypothetical protein